MFSTPTPVTKRWQQNQQKLDLTQRTTLSRQMGAPSACRESLTAGTSQLLIIVSHTFGGFLSLTGTFFALLEVVFMRDWLSLMQSALTFHFWPFTFFFFPQGKGCSACITARLQPCTLKINTWNSSVKISFNLLQVQAFRNNFPGWDCLLFSGPLAQEES